MSLAHRTLQYTHIETAGPLSVNEGEAVPMSRPIVFDCPGAKGTTCTLLIRVDSQYVGLTPGWNFDIWWVLDGQNRPGFGPTPGLAMASEVDRIWTANTVGFTVVKRQVPKGWHVLEGYYYLVQDSSATEPGTVAATVRTITLQVLKP
jgi:hypothetical protein